MLNSFVLSAKTNAWIVLMLFSSGLIAQKTKYKIEATLIPETELIDVKQEILFTNPDSKKLHVLYLQDWINAYKNTQTPLAKRYAEDFNRSFYSSAKSKRGFTSIDTLHNQTYPLVYQRLRDQPDILKVFLPEYLAPGATTTLTLNYTIKIPDSKFTGMGINDSGRINLKHWNIVVAPFRNDLWQLQSNLNLDDYSGLPSDYELTWHYPKRYYLTSNLIENKNEENDVLKTTSFNDTNRIQADFVFDTSNRFISVFLENGKEVVTDLLPPSSGDVNLKNTLERVTQYADKLYTPFPNDKILILKSNYNKNPFYGLSQLQTEVKISKKKTLNLKFFSDTFFYEIKLLKAYFGRYINQTLSIDKRKDHWVIGGLHTYAMIKYVEEFYPDQKFLGNFTKFKVFGFKPLRLFDNYSINKLGFNDAYEFIYEFAENSNIHQADKQPKDKLSKFNEKIAGPYHVGVGLRYIETYQKSNWLPETLKRYLDAKGKVGFEALLRDGNSNLDWFFDLYLTERKSFDLKIRESQKTNDWIRFKITSRDQRALPVLVGLVKEDTIIKQEWIQLKARDTVITWKHSKADYIAINPKVNFPEANKGNNWKSIKNTVGLKPLKFTLFKDAENLKKEQIFFHPVFDFNVYDGITSGVRLYNSKIKNRPFEFDFHPQYSFLEKSVVGFFKADYKLFKANSNNYLTRFRISGSSFHYDTNYRYTVLIPSIGWSFRPDNIRDNKRQSLQLIWYNVFREKSPNVVSTPDYSILNLRHIFVRNNTIDYLSSGTNIELSDSFGKIQFTGEARKLFPSGRQISGRVFLGKFLWHNSIDTQFFDFNLNRPSDYLFRYGYLGRSETTGIYSQQFIPAEGGFKSKFEESSANDYMLSVNASMGIWKWLEVYGDLGVLKNQGRPAKAYFDSGVKLNLSPDYLEIYLPVFSSNGFEVTQARFATKIRFILSPGFRTLTNLFSRKWF